MSIVTIGANARVHAHMMMVKRRWWNPFLKHTHDPQAVQQVLLERILTTQAETAFGKKYRLRDRKSTRLNSSHTDISRMPSSA